MNDELASDHLTEEEIQNQEDQAEDRIISNYRYQ